MDSETKQIPYPSQVIPPDPLGSFRARNE